MTALISFHGKQEVKNFFLNRVQNHYDADEIVQGITWEKCKADEEAAHA